MKYLLVGVLLLLTTLSYASFTWDNVKSVTGIERNTHNIASVKGHDTKCEYNHWRFTVPKSNKVVWDSDADSFLVDNVIKIHFFDNPNCINIRKTDKQLTVNKRSYKINDSCCIVGRFFKISYKDAGNFDLAKTILGTMCKAGYKSADSSGNTYVDDFLNLF